MKVLVVYYSLYGHVQKLAQAVAAGVSTVPGVELVLRRVQEFEDIEREVIPKSEHARAVREHHKDVPVCSLDDLKAADGFVFGTPTRFGNMCGQMRQFLDATGQLWMQGALIGKPASVFSISFAASVGVKARRFRRRSPSGLLVARWAR